MIFAKFFFFLRTVPIIIEATVFSSVCTRSKLAYIIDTLAAPQWEWVGGLFLGVSAWRHVTQHTHTAKRIAWAVNSSE